MSPQHKIFTGIIPEKWNIILYVVFLSNYADDY